MSDISKIKVSGVLYDIKDSQAREDLNELKTSVAACLNDIKSILNYCLIDDGDAATVYALKAQLAADIGALTDYVITQNGSVLTISKAPAEQRGSVLTIS